MSDLSLGHSASAARADLDTELALPGDSRTVTVLADYLDHNKVFNVRDYGAKGDGTTDDSTALAGADTAASAPGGVLAVPPGTYPIASDLTVSAAVMLRTDRGALLKPASGVTITINGYIPPVAYQIFDLSAGGMVVFGANNPSSVMVQWWGPAGDQVTDDTAAVQAFFDAVSGTAVKKAVFAGAFAVTSLVWDGSSTTLVECNANLLGTGSSASPVLEIKNATGVYFAGRLQVFGPGGSTYSTRTRPIGIKLNASGRTKFGFLDVQRFSIYGVDVEGGNSTLADLGTVRVYDCGASGQDVGKLSATFTARVDTGSSGSTAQRSVLTVDVLPDATEGVNSLCEIGGLPHVVTAIDPVGSTVTVYPWPDLTLATGEVNYLIGAGVYISGSNQNIINADMIDAARCGVAYRNEALYGGQVKRIVTQECAIGLTFGKPTLSTSLSHTVMGPYFENNVFDVVQVTPAPLASSILSPYEIDFAKCFNLAPRTSPGNTIDPHLSLFNGVTIYSDTAYLLGGQQGGNSVGSTVTVPLTPKPSSYQVYRANTLAVTLSEPAGVNRLFGYTDVLIMAYGSGSNDNPTGTWTFTAEAGYTVMGAASYAVSGMTRPTLFNCYRNGTDWRVSQFTAAAVVSGSKVYDPASLADGAGVNTIMTVTGAAMGDFVEASFSLDLQGIMMTAWVSAADTVTVRFQNETGAAVDLGSGTLRARVTAL